MTFEAGETEAVIQIKIVPHEEGDMRDESFGIQLSNITPAGAKLSKKNFQIVNIITDIERKKREDAYAQALKKLDDDEEISWGNQFVKACMLYP